jgi:endonuclease III
VLEEKQLLLLQEMLLEFRLVAVDTHVKRLSNLLGFIDSGDPEKIEYRLKELFPEKEWTGLSHRLAAHGRKICIARRPKCLECSLGNLCPSFNPAVKLFTLQKN